LAKGEQTLTTIRGRNGATTTLNLGSNEAYAAPVAAGISQLLLDGSLPPLTADPREQPPAGTGVTVLGTSGGIGVGGDVPFVVTVAYRANPAGSPPSSATVANLPTFAAKSINTETLLDSSNYVLSLNGYNGTVITGDGSDTIASAGNFDIRTGIGNDVIFAYGDNTVAAGGSLGYVTHTDLVANGSNIIVSGNGNDTIALNGISDVVFGSGYGTDTINGGFGYAEIAPGSQSINFVGGLGATTVFAGTGSDTVSLGNDGDLVFGGTAGHNNLTGGGALSGGGSTHISTLFGGGNGDLLTARGYGQTTLVANGNATLTGAASTANNIFYGLVGNASLQGGNGADTFVVGGSTVPGGVSDTVNGGPGQDLISILAGRAGSNITITSFTGAERVTLQGYAGGSATEAARALATAQIGGSTVLTLPDNTRVTIVGVTNLTSSSFV